MNSLVGYGVSSDSDSEGDENTAGNGSAVKGADVGEVTPVKRTHNFLVESGSASSDSGSESDPDPSSSSLPHPPAAAAAAASGACHPTLPAPSLGSLPPHRLPPPPLNTCSDSSVFANPFKAQADQKLSALQKHVPLTMQAKPSLIGGKRVCVSYRKDGRCRFGIKCKFAHDSDLQNPVPPSDCPPVSDEAAPVSEQAEPHAGGSCGAGSHNAGTEEEESGGQQGKKRRVGLSNTLIPPKRAMKQYAVQRDRERLNMA